MRPAASARIRGYAWVLAAIGLGVAAFSAGELRSIVLGLALAVFALLITDEHLIWAWVCAHCGHYFPDPALQSDPLVLYQWQPLRLLAGLTVFLIIGVGISVVLAYLGLDKQLLGHQYFGGDHILLALAYAAVLAVAIIVFEAMDRYRREPLIWREINVAMLLLGLAATFNLAISISWRASVDAAPWTLIGVLVVSDAIILMIAMRRSHLFVRPVVPTVVREQLAAADARSTERWPNMR